MNLPVDIPEPIDERNARLLPPAPQTIFLAALIGLVAGFGSVGFGQLIRWVQHATLDPAVGQALKSPGWWLLVGGLPIVGMFAAAWLTRQFAPEAEGNGVPEVIRAVMRRGGVIRPRVALVKVLASGVCIGTGGSVGREGPIIQIGAALGSLGGQLFRLPPRQLKTLVAAGAAAGISATFHAPLAGVVFAAEIILGSFAIECLTPIVVASVLANVVQSRYGEHGLEAAFPHLHYQFHGEWIQLPSYVILGLVCGLLSVGFTKLLYAVDKLARRRLPDWRLRCLVLGAMVGLLGLAYPLAPPGRPVDPAATHALRPPLLADGHAVIERALRLEDIAKVVEHAPGVLYDGTAVGVALDRAAMWRELWWLLPLALLKPLATSLTLGGGGSGGVFAPSLFIGAAAGAAFGLACNLAAPGWSGNPGVYAIVGMGAVVAGTTHGILGAVLIVYEMTNDYRIILPIMIAAGISSTLAEFIDRDSIYLKKLALRSGGFFRGHELTRLEHVMVRDVMIRVFPSLRHTDDGAEIIRVARLHPEIESLPVMNGENRLVGIIRPEDLHRLLDTDLDQRLVNAEDIAHPAPAAVSPDDNLLEALRDFGALDIETLPVESRHGENRRLVGLLLRADVMRRYRLELLDAP